MSANAALHTAASSTARITKRSFRKEVTDLSSNIDSSYIQNERRIRIIALKNHFRGRIKPIKYNIARKKLASFQRDGASSGTSAERETSAFRRFRKLSRSIMTRRPQVLQRIRISAPARRTVHSSPPQGWGFRLRITSPGRISSAISHLSGSRGNDPVRTSGCPEKIIPRHGPKKNMDGLEKSGQLYRTG